MPKKPPLCTPKPPFLAQNVPKTHPAKMYQKNPKMYQKTPRGFFWYIFWGCKGGYLVHFGFCLVHFRGVLVYSGGFMVDFGEFFGALLGGLWYN